jgi:D-alanyl-lipoteichoic acid acyltransferase DltB (MBOAT superfamily)
MAWFQDFWQALGPASDESFLFNSVLFGIVFTVLYALQLPLARRPQWRAYLLLAFSLYFYYRVVGWIQIPVGGTGEDVAIPFVAVMAFTGFMDWLLAQFMAQSDKMWEKRLYLLLSLSLSLGILGIFKYRNFFDHLYHSLAGGEGATLAILFPLGISYYTFKSISYMLDVFREEIEEPEPNPLNYLFYITFFPNVLMGPITRATEFLPQIRQPLKVDKEMMGTAFYLFLTGFFKKIVIADYLGENLVGRVFSNPGAYTGFENLVASYSYGLHLFADFSAYTDMAIALALLLGFRISPNFDEPFKAKNMTEFWRRWHISLSTWFRDYVYQDLSFAWRKWGRWGVALAALVTFFLVGFWHGPKWTYILWGSLHGVVIAWETITRKQRKRIRKRMNTAWYDGLSLFLNLNFLGFTFLFFNAKNMEQASLMLNRIFYAFHPETVGTWVTSYYKVLLVIGLGLLLHFLPAYWKVSLRERFVQQHWAVQAVIAFLMIVLIYQAKTAESQPFIYLQF